MKPVAAILPLLVLWTAPSHAAAPQLGYWDNWTDSAGVSHLTRCTLHRFTLKSVQKPATPEWQDKQAVSSTAIVTNVEPPGWVGGWHENPKPQWIVLLQGSWLLQAQDGSRAILHPGDLVIGEDQHTRPDASGHSGHLSSNPGPAPAALVATQLSGISRSDRPCQFE